MDADDKKFTRERLGLLTEEETAEALGVELETLQRWRSRGQGPKYTKPSKKVFYLLKDVQAWLHTCSSEPKAGDANA